MDAIKTYKDLQDMLAKRREEMQARIDRLNEQPETVSPDVFRMAEFRKAVQLFLDSMDVDTQQEDMLAVASVFPKYEVGKAYKVKNVFSYGKNAVGDPQLYQVLSAHTSAEEWKPDETPGLYKAIGVTEGGYPEWVQPLGATDAYEYGDIVVYKGTVYRSRYEGANVWSPEANPDAWETKK